MKKKLYKILVDGKSCNGGDLVWSLPRNVKGKWIPGDWHEVSGDLKMCERGLHLTDKPFKWYKWGCTNYEAEYGGEIERDEDKCVVRKARLLKEVPHPKWWTDACGWIETLKNIAWLKPDGKPKKEWKLFKDRAAARAAAGDAAWDAAWAAAWDAAWAAAWAAAGDAAWDAAIYAGAMVSNWNFESKHRTHIKKRMEVWQKGYGLLCDVGGVLYVYEKL